MAPAANGHRKPDPESHPRKAKRDPEDLDVPAGSPDQTDGLEELVDLWWSLYCPSCESRYARSATHCPKDGTELRHLSVVTGGGVTGGSVTGGGQLTGEFLSSADFFPRCPQCGSVFSLGEDTCPHDGTPLTWLGEPFQEPELPRVIGEKWRLVRRRGAGAFGTFYQGEHSILGMDVGIKILKSTFTSTEKGRRLFHNEAMRVSLLNHPNIVKVLDYGEDGDTPFLVMEYLKGKPLYHYMRDGELELEDRIDVICQVCESLTYAHSDADGREPLVHLDLKPEHIFLDRVGDHWHTKVIDFGIAEIVAPRPSDGEGDARPGRVAGTLPYMAPERFKGKVDPRSDLYSLGIILYELVAGRRPFDARNAKVLEELHETLVPTPPSRHGLHRPTATDRKLDAIILRALEKKIEDRPESARALLRSLEEWKALRAKEREERERSNAEKTLRVAQRVSLGVLVVAVILLPLLWGAPWEDITTTFPGRLIIGEHSPVDRLHLASIEDALFGGYQGETAFFELLSEDSSPVRLPRLNGMVDANGQIEIRLPSKSDLDRAVGAEHDTREWRARLRVVGQFGREVPSREFDLVPDYDLPEISEVPGGKIDGDSVKVPMKLKRLKIADHERTLDPEGCTLDGNKASPLGDDSWLVFPLPREDKARDLQLTLNRQVGGHGAWNERTWTVQRIRQPRITLDSKKIHGETIYTNQSQYGKSFREAGISIQGEWERVDVSIDNQLRRFTKDQEPRFELTFDGTKGEKSAKILVYSVFSEDSAAYEQDVTIRFWKRSLQIDSGYSEKAPTFSAGDEGAGISIVVTYKKEEVKFDLAPDTHELTPRGSLRGDFEAKVTVRDDYGNVATETFPFTYPPPPKVELSLAGNLGSKLLPLHPTSCACRDRTEPQDDLMLAVDLDYFDVSLLKWQLTVDRDFVDCQITDGADGLRLNLKKLLEGMLPGPHVLRLEATDTEYPLLTGWDECFLFYEDPKITVFPTQDELSPASSTVDVRIEIAGSAVKKVLVNGTATEPSDSNTFVKRIDIQRANKTDVHTEVYFKDGRVHELDRVYSRAPIEGHSYRFSVAKKTFTFTYATRGVATARGSAFFYTRAYDEVTLEDAEKHREALERALGLEATTNGKDPPEVSLSWTEDIRNIWHLEFEKEEPHVEFLWLSPADKHNHILNWGTGAYVRIDSTGVSASQGALASEQFQYRLIIEYQEDGWFVPKNALSESRKEGESKDASDSTQ